VRMQACFSLDRSIHGLHAILEASVKGKIS
jgi:hypothetical protein